LKSTQTPDRIPMTCLVQYINPLKITLILSTINIHFFIRSKQSHD